jgi:Mn-dependent DtxR family transcriptional regulator
MDTREIVLQTMQKAGKALRTGEVAEMAGVDKKDAEKAIKQLSTDGMVFSPVRCFWQAK